MKRALLVLALGVTAASSTGCRKHYPPVEAFELTLGGGCATLADASHWCWGTETPDHSAKPQQAPARPIASDTARFRLEAEGLRLCDHASTPADCETLPAAPVSFAEGPHHACIVTAEGSVRCRGEADHGRLGAGVTGTVSRLGAVAGVQGAKSVAVGTDFSCALLRNLTISCWGDNSQHALAQPDPGVLDIPAPVVGLFAVKVLAARGDQACASLTDGGVRCWGSAHGEGASMGRPGAVNTVPMPVMFP